MADHVASRRFFPVSPLSQFVLLVFERGEHVAHMNDVRPLVSRGLLVPTLQVVPFDVFDAVHTAEDFHKQITRGSDLLTHEY